MILVAGTSFGFDVDVAVDIVVVVMVRVECFDGLCFVGISDCMVGLGSSVGIDFWKEMW